MRLAAFDVETGGVDPAFALQPYRATLASRMLAGGVKQAWLTSYASAERVDGEVVVEGELYPSLDALRSLLNYYAESGTYVTAWNTPFDVAWLIALGLREEAFRINWIDGMLLYKHLTSSPAYLPDDERRGPKSYGLKPTVAEFFPAYAGYDAGIGFDLNPLDIEGHEKLLDYNKKDARFTLLLTEKFLAELSPAQKRVALLEAKCIPLIAETMVRGITTDTVAASVLSSKLADAAALAFVTLKLTDPQSVSEEVLASPTQLRELLYVKWGLTVPKLTDHPTNPQASTDKEALSMVADQDPRARLVRDYREAKNCRTKFAEGVILSTAYNGDGCVRPGARIFSTYTGRLTYSSKQGRGKAEVPVGIALHQWKRGKDFRALLQAPEGYTLLEFDFAGQEFKWMAVESGDQTMLGLCEPGEDAHSYMAARIEGLNYRDLIAAVARGEEQPKQSRYLGKVGNLSLQYRTGANRLQAVAKTQYGVVMSASKAKAIHATYQTTYPGVPRYWKRQIHTAQGQGWVETLAGRRVNLATGDRWTPETRWSYESTAINFPIQGVGADQKYLALAVLRNYLPKVDGRFYYELHDGMFVIVPDRYAPKAAVEIKHLLSNLPYKAAWGKSFPILFPVDAKSGKSWGDLKEIHTT